MQKQDFFQKALADFTHEAASGGAIRHLTDLGYTAKQVKELLDFPTSYERIQKTMWEHLLDTEVILLEEPGLGERKKRAVYVREYDRYGKASFRRVLEEDRSQGGNNIFGQIKDRDAEGEGWKEINADRDGKNSLNAFYALLRSKVEENGEGASYVTCDFGLMAGKDAARYQEMLNVLERDQREYLTGLPWTAERAYHRLNPRMLEILLKLYGTGYYHGICFFLRAKEKMFF